MTQIKYIYIYTRKGSFDSPEHANTYYEIMQSIGHEKDLNVYIVDETMFLTACKTKCSITEGLGHYAYIVPQNVS